MDGDYVWFEDVRVVLDGLWLACVVAGRAMPLPIVILHPDCRLAEVGDIGRLGVPRWWAEQRGLCAETDTNAAGSATDAHAWPRASKPPAPPSQPSPFPKGHSRPDRSPL